MNSLVNEKVNLRTEGFEALFAKMHGTLNCLIDNGIVLRKTRAQQSNTIQTFNLGDINKLAKVIDQKIIKHVLDTEKIVLELLAEV